MKRLYPAIALTCLLIISCGKSTNGQEAPPTNPPTDPPTEDPTGGPDFPGIVEEEGYSYTLDSYSRVLPLESAKALSDVDPDRKTFRIPAEVAKGLIMETCGKIIINTPTEQFPEGLLAMIQEVTPETDGSYLVRYSDAHLLECFKEMNVDECDIDLASHIKEIVDAKGNSLEFQTTRAAGTEKMHVTVPRIELDLPYGISVTPRMDADITMKTQVKIANYTLSTLNLIVDADCTIGADISADCDFTDISWTPRQQICSIILGAIPIGPLVVTPTLDIFAFISFDMNLKLEASVSYKRAVRAHLHYDEAAGIDISTRMYDEAPDAFQYTVGPKLEGGITYGLGIGPGVKLYGGSIGASISLNPGLKESISASFNLADDKSYRSVRNAFAFPWNGVSPTHNSDFVLNATAWLYGVGYGFSADTPPVTWPIKSQPVVPQLSDRLEVINDGQNVTVNAYVQGGQSLFRGPLTALLYHVGPSGIPGDFVAADFDFDQSKYEELESCDNVKITAAAQIEPGKKYNLDVIMDLNGFPLLLRSYETNTEGINDGLSSAIRAILKDLRASADGEWKKCNWDDPNVQIGDYRNVSLIKDEGMYYVSITIPEDWPMGSELTVKPHTEGLESILYNWELHVDGKDRHFSKVDIDDPLLDDIYISDHVESFGIHTEVGSRSLYTLPADIRELDFSRTFSISDNVTISLERYPNLKSMVFDDCPTMKVLTIEGGKKNSAMPSLKAGGGTLLSDLWLKNLTLGDNSSFGTTANFTNLHVSSSCSGVFSGVYNAAQIKLEGNFESISIASCPSLKDIRISYDTRSPSLSISLNPVLETATVTMRSEENPSYHIDRLSVTDCPQLKSLECLNIGMTSLELSGLPSLIHLDCCHNHKLTGEMLPFFDEMYSRGRTPSYDVRYYNYYWEGPGYAYKDRGYGFYYPEEPDCGYHRK